MTESSGDGATSDVAAREANEQVREEMWAAAASVYRRKWWIMAFALAVGIAAVFFTLRMPNQYYAESTVLIPDSGTSFASSALSAISPAAAALFGGGGGGFTRYLAILSSREMLGATVDEFDLVTVYDLSDAEYPRESAMAELADRASFEVDLELDYLAVGVLDPSPERAAQISNYLVERLNQRNIELTSSSAAQNRRFLQDRLDRANLELDSAQTEMQALQERYGVIEPDAQAAALVSALGQAEAQVAVAESEYQALRSQLGDENPDVSAARAALESARQQVNRLRGGGAVLPVPIQRLPRLQRQYAIVMQDIVMQQRIIEEVQPLYEQAALQEQRETDAVQVLDTAIPPTRKAAPRRSVLVLGATFSAGLIAVMVVLLLGWLRRHAPSILAKLRASEPA